MTIHHFFKVVFTMRRLTLALICSLCVLVQCSNPDCFFDTDCPSKQSCQEGKCIDQGNLNQTCQNAGDCPTNHQCIRNACVLLPTGYEFPEPTEEITSEEQTDAAESITESLPQEGNTETTTESSQRLCKTENDCLRISPTLTCRKEENGVGLVCLPRIDGGGGYGTACAPKEGVSELCATSICHPEQKKCTELCTSAEDCASRQCEEQSIAGFTQRVCRIDENECQSDRDCQQDEICQLEQKQDRTFRTRCAPPDENRKDLGASCQRDNDCKSNTCVLDNQSDYCSQLCRVDSDCGAGYACKTQLHPPDQSRTFGECVIQTGGLPCSANNECKRDGFVCKPTQINNEIVQRCAQANNALKKIGDACVEDKECISNICLPATKRCSAPCIDNTSCQGIVFPRCDSVPFVLGQQTKDIKICLPQLCDRTKTKTDCNAQKNEICAPLVDDTKKFVFSCSLPLEKQKDVGDNCEKHSECTERLCLNGRCARLCRTNQDCPNTNYLCANTTLKREKQNALSAKACTPPNNGFACTTTKDCSGQQDLCRLITINQTLTPRCALPTQGKAELGAPCTKNEECQSGTCLLLQGLCTKPCSEDAHCSLSGNPSALRCRKLPLTPTGGQPQEVNVCALAPCKGITECRPQEVCAYRSANNQDYLACVRPDPKKRIQGQSCQQNQECQSGLCTQNVCVAPCSGGQTPLCPLQTTCETTPTGPNSLHLCKTIPNACLRNQDCKQNNQICVFSLNNGRPERTCKNPVGQLQTGAECKKNDDCATNLCHPTNNICTEFCDLTRGDADCPSASTEYGCAVGSLSNQDVPFCRNLRCQSEKDCLSGETCFLEVDAKNNVQTRCRRVQNNTLGKTCTPRLPNVDCTNNFCNPLSQVCISPCLASRNCNDNQLCQDVNLGPFVTKGCVAGQRQFCDGNLDCLNNQICQASLTPQNVVQTTCQDRGNKKAPGASCSAGSECYSSVCDGLTQKCMKICKPGLNDCTETEICAETGFLGGRTVNVCLPKPDACNKTADCSQGTICGVDIQGAQISYLCLRPAQNGIDVGQACNPAQPYPGQCKSRICDPNLQQCAPTCNTDQDCNGQSRCGKIELNNGSLVRACIPNNANCERSATCPSTQPICALDLQQGNLVRRCIADDPKKVEIGKACDPALKLLNVCKNRFCEQRQRKCLQTCEKDTQCPTGLKCENTFVDGRPTKGCVPPNGAPCARETDCASPKICQANQTATTLTLSCQLLNGRDTGQLCNPKTFPNNCGSNLCIRNINRCVPPCQSAACDAT
ncbi:MAG: hypothetical protein AAGJ35_01305, partial [Myxococcota bacterium]